jgi:TolA-binding protein
VSSGSLNRRVGSGGRTLSFVLPLMLIGAIALSGCAVPQDNQQQGKDEDLRNTVASDRQQIEALQDEVNRLNDHIAEMEHNGAAGGDSSGDKKQLAELEQEVQDLKAGNSAPAVAGAAAASAPGGPPDANGAASPPGSGAPVAGAPPPGSPDAMSNSAPVSDNANNASSNDNADSDSDDSDNADNGSQVASAGPPPSVAPPRAPGPPLVNGSPSWRAMLDQELVAAQSSSDPAAKTYRAGLVAMKARKYPYAIGVFQGQQRRYPKSPLSEPAEYFSAHALFELGKYDQSILQFNDLVMRFPRGRFASGSLLNEAQAFMKMNDRIDARLTLQKLISDHPDAPEAATAHAMIDSLANG